MMIGTWDRLRSSRHTSTPEMCGSITSSSTRSGCTASNTSSASAPSRATLTRNPSRLSPMVRASTKESSSSTTSTVGSGALMVLSACLVGDGHGTRAEREPQRERGALPLLGVEEDLAVVVLDDVAHDGQPEPGAAGLAAAGPIHPVEPLEDPLEVPAGDADAVIPDRHLHHAPVGAGADLHGGLGIGVLHRVLEQVVEGGHELATVADHPEALGDRVDRDADPPLVGGAAHPV